MKLDMKLVKIRASDLWLILSLTEGKEYHHKCIKGLPEGSSLVQMYQDGTYNIIMIFTHESFRNLELGEEIPEFKIEFYRLGE